MSRCESCRFYHICKGRLYKTVSECARYKSVYSPQNSPQKRKELRKFEKELLKWLKAPHKPIS